MNQQMYQSMNLSGNLGQSQQRFINDEDLDIDREKPREEKKFEAINQSHPMKVVEEV